MLSHDSLLTTYQVPPPPRRRQRLQPRVLRFRFPENRRGRPRSRLSGRQHWRSEHLHGRRPWQHYWRRLPNFRSPQPNKVRLLLLPAESGSRTRFPEERGSGYCTWRGVDFAIDGVCTIYRSELRYNW